MDRYLIIDADTKIWEMIETIDNLLEPYGLAFNELTKDKDEHLTYELTEIK